MNKENMTCQGMNYKEREALKAFAGQCEKHGDIQSLTRTVVMIAHWMRQSKAVSFTEYASQWTGQNGETRQGWQVIADSVISARTARPGGKKGQQGQATDALNRAKQQTGQHDDLYGDNIPF